MSEEIDMLERCKGLLLERNINPVSSIEYDVNGELHTLTLEWIITAYLQAQKSTLFITLFEKALQGSDKEIEIFFQQMGQLILMSSLTENALEEK